MIINKLLTKLCALTDTSYLQCLMHIQHELGHKVFSMCSMDWIKRCSGYLEWPERTGPSGVQHLQHVNSMYCFTGSAVCKLFSMNRYKVFSMESMDWYIRCAVCTLCTAWNSKASVIMSSMFIMDG